MGDTGSLALGGGIAGLAVFTQTELLLPLIGRTLPVTTLSVILQVGSFKTHGSAHLPHGAHPSSLRDDRLAGDPDRRPILDRPGTVHRCGAVALLRRVGARMTGAEADSSRGCPTGPPGASPSRESASPATRRRTPRCSSAPTSPSSTLRTASGSANGRRSSRRLACRGLLGHSGVAPDRPTCWSSRPGCGHPRTIIVDALQRRHTRCGANSSWRGAWASRERRRLALRHRHERQDDDHPHARVDAARRGSSDGRGRQHRDVPRGRCHARRTGRHRRRGGCPATALRVLDEPGRIGVPEHRR